MMFRDPKKSSDFKDQKDLAKAYDKLLEENLSTKEALKKANVSLKGLQDEESENLAASAVGFAGLTNAFTSLNKAKDDLKKSFSTESLLKDIVSLQQNSQELANKMGLGSARAGELRSTIANTVPEMIKLGISESETIEKIGDVTQQLKVNTTLSKESIVGIGAASKIAGMNAGTLAKNFKDAGINLNQIGPKMAEAANYAKGVGVNVQAVTQGVANNLKNLSLYNFEGGVQGLTKMVAKSEMLGGVMDKVLQKAEGILNPEAAIEFSSTLQQLGVQSSALLDPLSAMDMALNDPAKLQEEMAKVSQQFTRMKADGSGFEILPGAKLQLREVAKAMGMNADELANMSIKSADLDMKMSKIRFPSFAASEEDKQLIANMSQMKDGKAVVQIKDESGEMKEVDVENLTAEQLKELKKDQADQNKSAEELAREQLDVQKQIASNTLAAIRGGQLGVATAGPIQRMTDAAYKVQETTQRAFLGQISTEGTRKAVGQPLGAIEKGVVDLTTGEISVENLLKAFSRLEEVPGMVSNTVESIGGGLKKGTLQAFSEGSYEIQKTYSEVTGKEAVKPTMENSSTMQQVENVSNVISQYYEKAKQAVTIESKADVNVKVSADQSTLNLNQQQQNSITTAIANWFQDNNNLTSIYSKMKELNTGTMPSGAK